MTTEYKKGVGYSTVEEADDLSEFAFEDGEMFVRWVPWGDEREDEDVWAIKDRTWKYTVSWIRDRDNVPTTQAHRRYTLISRETWHEREVSETELKRGEWRLLSEVECL